MKRQPEPQRSPPLRRGRRAPSRSHPASASLPAGHRPIGLKGRLALDPDFLAGTTAALGHGSSPRPLPARRMASVRHGSTALPSVFDLLRYLALPARRLGLHHTARMARATRAVMVEILGERSMRSARTKGMPTCHAAPRRLGWAWDIGQGCASLNLPIFIDITIDRMVQRATFKAKYAAIASEAGGGSHGIAQVG